jgi:hypothetical protein
MAHGFESWHNQPFIQQKVRDDCPDRGCSGHMVQLLRLQKGALIWDMFVEIALLL